MWLGAEGAREGLHGGIGGGEGAGRAVGSGGAVEAEEGEDRSSDVADHGKTEL